MKEKIDNIIRWNCPNRKGASCQLGGRCEAVDCNLPRESVVQVHELYMDWFKEEVEKLGLIEGLENEYIPEDAAYDQLIQDKQTLCYLLEKSKWEKSK